MMDVITEQDIEQQLAQEMQKLKKAVAYIEEAKETARASSELLADLNSRLAHLRKEKAELNQTAIAVDKQLRGMTSEFAADKIRHDKSIKELKGFIGNIEFKMNDELSALKKSNNQLKIISYTSISIVVILTCYIFSIFF